MYRDIGDRVDDVAASAPAAAGVAAAGDDEPASASASSSAAGAAAAAGPDGDEDDEDTTGGGSLASGVHTVEGSLCMSCGESGTTRLLPTRIPFFREIIICAFSCPECGFRSSDVLTSQTQEKGCRFELRVGTAADAQRQLLKSDKATLRVPELDLEIPHTTMSGVFTTVEGVLANVAEDLEGGQVVRRAVDPDTAGKIDAFLALLRACAAGEDSALPFTVVLDDPSGNSFLENPRAPSRDPALAVRYYRRTAEQNEFCGLNSAAVAGGDGGEDGSGAAGSADTTSLVGSAAVTTSTRDAARPKAGSTIAPGSTDRSRATPLEDTLASAVESDVQRFPTPCPTCGGEAQTRMCLTNIPHFKEVLLMALVCPHCGFKDVEIKGGGAVPPQGTSHTLLVTPESAAEDMRRDVLKSDSAGLCIPDIELEMEPGSLGGLYTTVEGLLGTMKDRIVESNPLAHAVGDSSGDAGAPARFRDFLERFDAICAGTVPFTLQLRDPMANSWVYSPWDDEASEAAGAVLSAGAGQRGAHVGTSTKGVRDCAAATGRDPRLSMEWYDRSEEEDVDLGLKDMDVGGFPNVGAGHDEAASGAAPGAGGDDEAASGAGADE